MRPESPDPAPVPPHAAQPGQPDPAIDPGALARLADAAGRLLAAAVRRRAASAKTSPDPTDKT